jgi:hypothetical protein
MRLTLIVAVALALPPAALVAPPRRVSDRRHGYLRSEKEAEESEGAKARIPQGRARHRPKRAAEIGTSAPHRPDRDHDDHDRDEL